MFENLAQIPRAAAFHSLLTRCCCLLCPCVSRFLLSPEGVWIREFLLEVRLHVLMIATVLRCTLLWRQLQIASCLVATWLPCPVTALILLKQELVKSIDALSRDQLRALLVRLNLQNLAVPVVIPGANRWAWLASLFWGTGHDEVVLEAAGAAVRRERG